MISFDALSDRRVVLFGGKGGVGKTTISTAAALQFSETQPTILFTTDPASNLSDIFTDPVENLTIESLDAEKLYARFLDENLASFLELGDRGTYLDREELKRLFELSLPGVDELMAWMRIGELAEEHPDHKLIVDTAPTGHTLRMVGAAHHFEQLSSALDAMQAKHRGIVRQFTRRSVRDAMDEFLEEFEAKAKLYRSAITTFVPVFLAEPWIVEQTRRLIDEVRREGIDVPFAILNRVDPCGHSGDATLDVPVVKAPRACFPLDSSEAIKRWSRGPLSHPSPRGSGERVGEAGVRGLRISRLTFLAGKGGVGKTTCSASIALQLAQRAPEKKFTVISVDPAHSLRDVFAKEKPPANLTVETIDTRTKWRTFRDTLGQEIDRAMAAITPGGMTIQYDSEAMKQLVEIAPPGADELFAIDRLADLIADESQAGIIVDTAPTGHFLRLLDLPRTAGEWVREFMRLLLRYRELVPAGTLGEELLRASRALHALEKTLTSADCEVIVVTRPERVVVAETRRLIENLESRGMRVGGVIANAMTPKSDCQCDQSMRGYEIDALKQLDRPFLPIERQRAPVTSLAGLARLIPLD